MIIRLLCGLHFFIKKAGGQKNTSSRYPECSVGSCRNMATFMFSYIMSVSLSKKDNGREDNPVFFAMRERKLISVPYAFLHPVYKCPDVTGIFYQGIQFLFCYTMIFMREQVAIGDHFGHLF
mgnify:CR=1 FL=1